MSTSKLKAVATLIERLKVNEKKKCVKKTGTKTAVVVWLFVNVKLQCGKGKD